MTLRDKVSSLYSAYFNAVGKVITKAGVISTHCISLRQGVDSGMSPDIASLVEFVKLVEPPATVLDLGAGVSTYVFRSLFDSVVTVDSDQTYLEFVRSICQRSGLSDTDFFCGMRHVDADYVFFDYGTTDDRIRLLEEVVSCGRRMVWVNDADDRPAVRPLVKHLRSLCQAKGLTLEPRLDVRDCYGRYGSIIWGDKSAPPVSRSKPVASVSATSESKPKNVSKPLATGTRYDFDLSILLGTYNRLTYLQHCIATCRRAVKDLSYEIVVCDGGSTDGSREWLVAQPDVVLIGKRTLDGAVDAFNYCFHVCRGEFVSALNDDAEVLDTALADGVAHLRENPDCGQVAFAFKGEREAWHVNHVYPDALWSTVYANFGVTRRSVAEAVCYITGGMWAPVYRTYAGDCELSAWIHRLGREIAVRDDLRIEDLRVKDDLRDRNDGFANFEAGLFYSRWPCEAFRKNGITPNVSRGELDRYQEVVSGNWASSSTLRTEELKRFQNSLDYVRTAPPLWPVPDREPFLAALAPRIQVFDPQPDRFPYQAEPLGNERVLHVHLGTKTDPQDALVRAIRALASDDSVYRRIDWPACNNLTDQILNDCATIRPTLVFMQLQTPDVISPGTVDEIRRRSDPNVVIATWNGDVASNNSPWSVEWQVPLGRAVDLTLHSSMTHVRALRAAGVHTAGYLQIGYDQEQYRPAEGHRANDVCFLGSRYYDDAFSKSMKYHEGPLRDAVVLAMRRAFGGGFALYGSGYSSDFGHAVVPIPVLKSHTAFQAAKLAISISLSSDFEMYSSDRLHRALACGGAVLVKRFAGMGSWGLRHGENCLVWETADEAVALAQTAVASGSWARVGAAGAELAVQHLTWDVRMRELQPYINAARSVR